MSTNCKYAFCILPFVDSYAAFVSDKKSTGWKVYPFLVSKLYLLEWWSAGDRSTPYISKKLRSLCSTLYVRRIGIGGYPLKPFKHITLLSWQLIFPVQTNDQKWLSLKEWWLKIASRIRSFRGVCHTLGICDYSHPAMQCHPDNLLSAVPSLERDVVPPAAVNIICSKLPVSNE